MTPLMLSILLWRAVHPNASTNYCSHGESATVAGAMLKLQILGAIRITNAAFWEYELTERGHRFVRVLTMMEF